MLHLIMAFTLSAAVPSVPDGLPVAPLDIAAGNQRVALREPLIARHAGASLVVLVRDRAALGVPAHDQVRGFERALPMGSVTAHLRGADGADLVLEHTGYVYHRGQAGLLLTGAGGGKARYDALDLAARRALPGVRLVWLDRPGRLIDDVRF